MLILNVTLQCSNCGSELVTETTNTSEVVKVTPCSCRGDCPLCGGSGVDFDARGNTRPCPCKSSRD